MWLSVFGTFAVRGSIFKKVAKIFSGLLFLPDSVIKIFSNRRKAEAMMKDFPKIGALKGKECAS